MRAAREWNLSWQLRLVIVFCAACYLFFSKPWTEPDQSKAIGAYTCSMALAVLALIPKRTRLWVAICAALAVPVITAIVMDCFHLF
jgi:hypothetical protein